MLSISILYIKKFSIEYLELLLFLIFKSFKVELIAVRWLSIISVLRSIFLY